MLQVTYLEYRFSFISVIVGVRGTMPIDLRSNIKKFGFDDNAKAMKMIQQRSIIGNVKICKTFITFKT